jgi:2-polyprenyl-6-methoxyphenol hydroxylase-like FAD-dependent oxidoreductase
VEHPNNIDVLVVGAGPTGLTLACQLARFGVRFRIIDKQLDRAHESRALGVQARTLEILQTLGLGEELVGRGSSTTRVMLHVDRREPPTVDLGYVGRTDTRFPFILFVPQPDTEAVLTNHLVARGVAIERGVELLSVQQEPDRLGCTVRHDDGREESVSASYVAGCDGAHSTVRKVAGIQFEGGAYPQHFVLGDVEADGIQPGAIHAFAAGRGIALFFPLGHPATWRVMSMEPAEPQQVFSVTGDVATEPLSLEELQTMIDEPTYGSVRIGHAAWLTRFRLHHRQALQYRHDRFFLAGDAAHIHSPVGAQGMNTGIQDAWNLGWKLALVTQGAADRRLLDSYHAERWPVGQTLLRVTDRLFARFAKSVAGNRVAVTLRRWIVRGVVAPALARPGIRAAGFHFVSQLGIHYRTSPAVLEGVPRLHHGPMAGDRLPDLRVQRRAMPTSLQQELASPHLHWLLCGPLADWVAGRVKEVSDRWPRLLLVSYLSRDRSDQTLVDPDGQALAQLGVEHAAQYLVRPDGHVAFRCGGTDLAAAAAYLNQWFTIE